ncbi:MAG: YfcE family phosphodiesterase [Proteobacteria bacterium]|nr:YfcE family phosphodiesterase [Pseudomonadota bacterium]
MKIGVISDTHVSTPVEALCSLADDIFADVSMILHAGDLTRLSVLEAFPGKEVIAVSGNMDRYDVTSMLPKKKVIEVFGYRIGLIHGWGSPKGLEEKIIACFDDVQVIVYGHTHRVANHINQGILMFNPGAFSGTHPFGSSRSVGVLNINETHGISGTIINI